MNARNLLRLAAAALFALLPLLAIRGGAVGISLAAPEPRLNISHVSCVACTGGQGANVEVHFVLVNGPDNAADYGSVSYVIQLPDGSQVARVAPFDKHVGNAIHYTDHLIGVNGAYTLISASVTVDGVGYSLANPGSGYNGRCDPCPPVTPEPTPPATPESARLKYLGAAP